MNLQETILLLEALHKAGATHFKSDDFEVSLGEPKAEYHIKMPDYKEPPRPDQPIENVSYDPVQTQKVQDLIDTLKLKDEELLNKIMPDGAM